MAIKWHVLSYISAGVAGGLGAFIAYKILSIILIKAVSTVIATGIGIGTGFKASRVVLDISRKKLATN
jgi:uncharacterized membrane protein